MRTNVVIDDELMREAMEASGLSTKRAVIEQALRALIRAGAARRLIELGGQVAWEDQEEESPDGWDSSANSARQRGN